MQYFGNGCFKLQGESVSFRMTKPVQHPSQFSTSEQMSHSNADQCVLDVSHVLVSISQAFG